MILVAVFGLFVSELAAQIGLNRVLMGVRFDGKTSFISLVVKGGPADRAGIEVGDELLSIGERFILQPIDVVFALDGKAAGDAVRLEVRRGEQFLFFDLKLIPALNGDKVIDTDGRVVVAPPRLAIQDELAPELKLASWHGWSQEQPPRLREMQGKVICLLLFQTDCEYSRRYAIPQFRDIANLFAEDPMVELLAVQTPFRNFEKNTRSAAIGLFGEMGVEVPLGHDGSARKRSVTYDSYKAPGTPWIIVIDKQGVVRFNDSRLPLDEARELITDLKMETR